MKTYVLIAVLVALGVIALVWTLDIRTATAPGKQACTQEAKLCPDGSAVGRTGPNCEFAECPAATTATSTSGGGGILPYASGIQGTVTLGPTCPVERIPPDPACADKPYVTTVVVRRTGSRAAFASMTSTSAGTFKFSLPPGNYTVTATGGAMLPRCNAVDVTVAPTGYATADISCDTGIR